MNLTEMMSAVHLVKIYILCNPTSLISRNVSLTFHCGYLPSEGNRKWVLFWRSPMISTSMIWCLNGEQLPTHPDSQSHRVSACSLKSRNVNSSNQGSVQGQNWSHECQVFRILALMNPNSKMSCCSLCSCVFVSVCLFLNPWPLERTCFREHLKILIRMVW